MADAVITRLVRRGMVTNADLSAAGVSQDEIDWRVKRKRLIAVWRGVSRRAPRPRTPGPRVRRPALRRPGRDTQRPPRRRAVGPAPHPGGSHHHLSLKAKRASPKGLKLHTRDLHPHERTTVHQDLEITTPERTILDVAPTLDDEQLEQVVATAIRNRLTTERRLDQQLQLRKGARGIRRISAILDEGPQWTASQAEGVFLRMLRAAELADGCELNKRMGRRMPDFLWREQRVIVEIDSWRWHGDRLAFERDNDRRSRWSAQGWTVLPFTPRQLRHHPHLVVARVAAALAG